MSVSNKKVALSRISDAINSKLQNGIVEKLRKEIDDAIDADDCIFLSSLLNDRMSPEKDALSQLIAIRSIKKDNPYTLNTALRCLLNGKIPNYLLFVCIEYDSLDCCKILLHKGLSPNTWRDDTIKDIFPKKSTNDATPLHYACSLGRLSCLKLLHKEAIRGNLNIGVKYGEEHSLLHTATRYDKKEIVEYLLQNGANKMGSRTENSTAPLHVAAKLNHDACVQILLDAGVEVDALNNSKRQETPLHLAAEKGSTEVAKILIRNSANINAETDKGETPLHYASKCLSLEIMNLLIEHGADVDAQDKGGRSPLHCVALSRKKGTHWVI